MSSPVTGPEHLPGPNTNGEVRSRTVTWFDPVETAKRLAKLSGLEAMRALMRGEVPPPPIATTLEMWPIEVDEGRAVFAVEPAEFHYNPIGVVHGGLAATLLDSAMGCAVQTTLPAGTGYTTLDLHTNFVHPITVETGRVRCEGVVLHRGRTVATAEGRVVAEETGRLVAHGTTTCLVLER
jgi:uncharacterized protein (TIGR00369 family)